MTDIDKLLAKDEHGFFHMAMVSGNSVAFAPSHDVERGEALIADVDKSELQRLMDLKEAFSRPGHTVFLMNVDDFEELIGAIKKGVVRPFTRQ
ncbi:hypothetical protein [Sinorhizobium fredii]|uniref:hypothetical protein n=1 Tax=Rhizobium fredii TaxID=380 RepID=UPI0035194068